MARDLKNNATFLALLTVLLWSTVATAFKLALNHLTPLQLVFYATLVSWLFFLCVVIYQKSLNQILPLFLTRPWLCFVSGVLNPFLYFWLLFAGFALLPAQQAQAINYTWPLILSFLVVFTGQKLRLVDVVALLIAYFGVLLIVSQGQIDFLQHTNIWGVILVFASNFLWAIYWLVQRQRKGHAAVALLVSFSLCLPVNFIALIYFEGLAPLSLKGFSLAAYVGLVEMGFTYLVWLRALQLTRSLAVTNQIILLTPFVSLFFIALFLHEPVTWISFLGLAIIVGAVVVQKQFPEKLRGTF